MDDTHTKLVQLNELETKRKRLGAKIDALDKQKTKLKAQHDEAAAEIVKVLGRPEKAEKKEPAVHEKQ